MARPWHSMGNRPTVVQRQRPAGPEVPQTPVALRSQCFHYFAVQDQERVVVLHVCSFRSWAPLPGHRSWSPLLGERHQGQSPETSNISQKSAGSTYYLPCFIDKP